MKAAPILIIDKIGLIGTPLALKLSKEFPVVLVSKSPSANVPFSKRFPVIPDNKYSHIIAIESEESDLEFLHTIIKKAKDVNSDFIFVEELSTKGQYHVGKALSEYSSAKVVLYGDVFDYKLIHKYEGFKSVINKFIYQAQRFGKIQILGDGLRYAFPVSLDDVVDGIIDLVFGINDKHSLFYIFPKHPVTELSLAHMIQKANPQISIDFINKDPRKEDIAFPHNGKYLLDDEYNLTKKIKSIDIGKKIKLQEKANIEEYSKRKKRFPMFAVWILIFLIFSPLVFTLIFSFLGLNTLYFAKTQMVKGSFSNIKSSLHLSNTFFYIGKKASDILYLQLNFIGREGNLKRLLHDIDSGYEISEAALQAFNSEIYFSRVFNGKSKNPIDDFAKGQSDLKGSIVRLEKLRAEGKIPAPFLQKLEIINPLIKLLSNTSDVLPGVFGMGTPRTYLILFQNNMELRPGGGFIGSYGVLKVNMGRITQFVINDVYDADGQLRGHVEPPFAVRRHLPSVHWYLRDSNFDVDFAKSASVSSNFLYVETGQEAKGVIGVDVSFVENILRAIGPVYVADYKETVDESNLYMLTQAHSEKDFLISLYKTIIAKISEKNVSYLLLAKALSDSLSQKHLIFAFSDKIQNIFTVNGWSSSLWDERKNDENSVNDFLGINEANLGVNKVNYFISRQVTHKVTIDDNGKVLEELDVSYKNASTSWPGGDYKNYLRIILPEDTTISEILVNDIPQILVDAVTDPQIYEDKNFKPPIGLEIERVNQDNKTIYGFIVNVGVGEIIKVKVKYDLAKKAPLELTSFSYNLRLFKQPGIDSIPYSFALTYPNNFNITKGKSSHSEKFIEDKDLIIDFSRK